MRVMTSRRRGRTPFRGVQEGDRRADPRQGLGGERALQTQGGRLAEARDALEDVEPSGGCSRDESRQRVGCDV